MHTVTDIQIPVSHTHSSGKTIKKRENETQGRRMNCAQGRAVGQGWRLCLCVCDCLTGSQGFKKALNPLLGAVAKIAACSKVARK